jgi:DNA-binding NarL/FixJ family response regulator
MLIIGVALFKRIYGMIKVAIIEDDKVFLERIGQVISQSAHCRLVGTAHDFASGGALIRETAIDVCIVDLGLPDGDGCDLIAMGRARCPGTQFVTLSVFGDDNHVMRAIEAGAVGYVLKDDPEDYIINSVIAVNNGGSVINPMVARNILQKLMGGRPAMPVAHVVEPQAAEDVPTLSEREQQVLELLSRGSSVAAIATALKISAHTVNMHLRSIYRRLAVNSRTEAIYVANQKGILGH